MKFKTTIIFDFDGTIVDSLDFFVEFIFNEANKLGYELTQKEIKNMIRNKNLRHIIKDYKLSKLHILYIVWKLRRDFKKVLEEVKIFDGIDILLRDLDKKYDVYLLSSNDKKHILKIFDKYSLNSYFKKTYFKSSLFGKHQILKKVLKKNNLEKDSVVYIGDELRDFQACQKINIDCINVSYGFNSKKLLKTENKEYVVNSIDELRNLLL